MFIFLLYIHYIPIHCIYLPYTTYSSYYSSDGCIGNIAQYDLVSEQCSVYGYPISAFGTFQCLAEGNLISMQSPYYFIFVTR